MFIVVMTQKNIIIISWRNSMSVRSRTTMWHVACVTEKNVCEIKLSLVWYKIYVKRKSFSSDYIMQWARKEKKNTKNFSRNFKLVFFLFPDSIWRLFFIMKIFFLLRIIYNKNALIMLHCHITAKGKIIVA